MSNDGSVQHAETVTTNNAAIVNQTLPIGNLVVEGIQQIRVNFELRELIVADLVRLEESHPPLGSKISAPFPWGCMFSCCFYPRQKCGCLHSAADG